MNSIKISVLSLLLVGSIHHSFASDEIITTNQNSTFSQFLSNHDPRYFVLTGLGVAAGALGLWIIKQSVDKMLIDNAEENDVAITDKMLRLGSKSLATLIGLACTIGGGFLIIMDKYKIESSSNTIRN